ncbi:ABC transporter ATP-binding protein [Clostridium botulinum]|nr:ABC transporter ATP-binding protein [Clostridium botulinum]
MKDGKIIEKGSHKELINNNGEYKNMYEAQASYYR